MVVVNVEKEHPEIDAGRFPPELLQVPSDDLVVWIDPLDGTKHFTQGELDAVTVLLGITVKGVPTAGVIGCPFA